MLPTSGEKSGLDMDGLPLDIRTQFRPERLLSYQINGISQQVFQVKLGAEIAFGSCRSVETNQDVDVPVFQCLVASHGSEKDEIGDPNSLRKGRLVGSKQFQDFVAGHWSSREVVELPHLGGLQRRAERPAVSGNTPWINLVGPCGADMHIRGSFWVSTPGLGAELRQSVIPSSWPRFGRGPLAHSHDRWHRRD